MQAGLTAKYFSLVTDAFDPNKNVKLIQVGGTAQMVAAIYRGLIQFALFNEPFVRGGKLGLKTLIDVPSQ